MSDRLEEIGSTQNFVLIAVSSDEMDTFHIIWGNVTLNLTLSELCELHDLMRGARSAWREESNEQKS